MYCNIIRRAIYRDKRYTVNDHQNTGNEFNETLTVNIKPEVNNWVVIFITLSLFINRREIVYDLLVAVWWMKYSLFIEEY